MIEKILEYLRSDDYELKSIGLELLNSLDKTLPEKYEVLHSADIHHWSTNAYKKISNYDENPDYENYTTYKYLYRYRLKTNKDMSCDIILIEPMKKYSDYD